ncbi:hypothetical protein [Flaviaesturariibacter aridisoli]|uniref:DUF4890 domain-containing protein n=1 Tax=Flaviaesturariibacter aridisoli TaxID=2545761 RepID=A0A4R4E1G7_9BACT|nr:hypothetical protein [Flaviaesturariibacter aridisoli]TCZ68603.1 hypothetical protein E0486_13860 [Flaviaesturariibacter aridisoli]
MKKILLVCCFAVLGATSFAQSGPTDAPVSKEEKARQKARQEQDLNDAFKATGLTDSQVSSVREVLETASKASKELKANTALTEDQKVEAKKKISDDKNTRLKEIMGADTYRKWNEVRKEQKARASAE